jgi:hypothetical protein
MVNVSEAPGDRGRRPWFFATMRRKEPVPATRSLCPLQRILAGWGVEANRASLIGRNERPLPRPRGQVGSTGSGHLIVRGASRMRMIRAGTPPTTAFAGTFLVTTALAPTIELSPT